MPQASLICVCILALSLANCGEDTFTRSGDRDKQAMSKRGDHSGGQLNGNLHDADNYATTSGSLSSSDGYIPGSAIFSVSRVCSNINSDRTAVNLMSATNGFGLKFYPQLGSNPLIRNMGEDFAVGEPIVIDSYASERRDQAVFYGDIAVDVPDGTYLVQVCDINAMDDCQLETYGPVNLRSRNVRVRDSRGSMGLTQNVVITDGQAQERQALRVVYNKNPDGATLLTDTALENRAPSGGAYRGIYECDSYESPLMIDLSGSGLQLSAPSAGALFDIDADGTKERISWPVARSSVFVGLDRNGNGQLDHGGELFGNHTQNGKGNKATNGFLALAHFDTNGDRRIDARDAVYRQLLIWQDNGDGISQTEELQSLRDHGIVSLDLNYTERPLVDPWGNQLRQSSTVMLANGEERPLYDIWFKTPTPPALWAELTRK